MPIQDSELVLYGSASRPDDEVSTVGGAIDQTARPLETQLSAPATPAAVSDDAGDTTQTITITGRNTAGEEITDQVALNGTTEVQFSEEFERFHTIELDGAAAGNVEIREGAGGTVRHTLAPGETDAFLWFRNAVSSDAEKVYYEKAFFRNNNATLTLLNAEVELTDDPDALIEIAIGTAKDDTETTSDRLTAPAAVGAFTDDDVALDLPDDNLAAGEAIAVWFKLTLAADEAAGKGTHTARLSGASIE